MLREVHIWVLVTQISNRMLIAGVTGSISPQYQGMKDGQTCHGSSSSIQLAVTSLDNYGDDDHLGTQFRNKIVYRIICEPAPMHIALKTFKLRSRVAIILCREYNVFSRPAFTNNLQSPGFNSESIDQRQLWAGTVMATTPSSAYSDKELFGFCNVDINSHLVLLPDRPK